jgi:transketolase
MSTGSEVQLCVAAYEQLKSEGIKARVVSMPSWAIFEKQSEEYRQQIFPAEVKARVAVEQASTFGWSQYVGPQGKVIGMHTFGSSAPLKDVLKKFGFSPDKVVEAARAAIRETK